MTTSYTKVAEILERAAGDGEPGHQGHGRFWTLPLQDFLAIGTIYGVEVIAEEGVDRGIRSGLIKALRGEDPFIDEDMGQMPLGRPPVPDDEIQYIQHWIDEGCPE